MHIVIAAIGKAKESLEHQLFEKYRQAIEQQSSWRVELKELTPRKNVSGDMLKSHEADLLQEAVKNADHLICLDERGKTLSSMQLAEHFSTLQNNSVKTVAFVIGGADGLAENLIKKANLSLSFGKATWPHMLVRPMLAEQIYRVEKILANHPYHRE